jgi:hypothetical protein
MWHSMAKDIWAYHFMRGWSANKRIDFELLDAHDLDIGSEPDRGIGEPLIEDAERVGKGGLLIAQVIQVVPDGRAATKVEIVFE